MNAKRNTSFASIGVNSRLKIRVRLGEPFLHRFSRRFLIALKLATRCRLAAGETAGWQPVANLRNFVNLPRVNSHNSNREGGACFIGRMAQYRRQPKTI